MDTDQQVQTQLLAEARRQTQHLERISQIVTFLFVLGMIAAGVWVFTAVLIGD